VSLKAAGWAARARRGAAFFLAAARGGCFFRAFFLLILRGASFFAGFFAAFFFAEALAM
jgi:hypothetical protein